MQFRHIELKFYVDKRIKRAYNTRYKGLGRVKKPVPDGRKAMASLGVILKALFFGSWHKGDGSFVPENGTKEPSPLCQIRKENIL